MFRRRWGGDRTFCLALFLFFYVRKLTREKAFLLHRGRGLFIWVFDGGVLRRALSISAVSQERTSQVTQLNVNIDDLLVTQTPIQVPVRAAHVGARAVRTVHIRLLSGTLSQAPAMDEGI